MNASEQTAALAKPAWTVLCVDDEANILNALRRLFRQHGYRFLAAPGGAEGLKVLEAESVDLVISDMRMPEMNGAQFLQQVRERWPDTIRILLTGHSDISSTVAAINQGEIYRYIAKPWDDNEVPLIVRHALERKDLEREKARLELLTRRQNEQLRDLNANLEQKVRERTDELQRAMDSLATANEKLKGNFVTAIKVFSNVIEMREGGIAGHSRRVADLARKLALHLGLDRAAVQDVLLAGLLHDIGKIGLPDALLSKPVALLDNDESVRFRTHPVKGATLLTALEELRGAAALLRSHHERFDGLGYPDGLKELAIPLGACILAVANDYDSLQFGTLVAKRQSAAETKAYIQKGRGQRYHPKVVDALFELLAGDPAEAAAPASELTLTTKDLKAGMVLSRDLVTDAGAMLLAADYLLEDTLIAHFRNLEEIEGHRLTIYVRAGRR